MVEFLQVLALDAVDIDVEAGCCHSRGRRGERRAARDIDGRAPDRIPNIVLLLHDTVERRDVLALDVGAA